MRAQAQPWRSIGSVQQLFVRERQSACPRPVAEAQAITDTGLQDDRHANPLSPRQLLIASADTYRDLRLPAAVLRENLLIDFPTQQLDSGSLLRVGQELVLWVTFQCEPCQLLDRRRPGLVKHWTGAAACWLGCCAAAPSAAVIRSAISAQASHR